MEDELRDALAQLEEGRTTDEWVKWWAIEGQVIIKAAKKWLQQIMLDPDGSQEAHDAYQDFLSMQEP